MLKPYSREYFAFRVFVPGNVLQILGHVNGSSGEISRFHKEYFVPVRVLTRLNSFVSV